MNNPNNKPYNLRYTKIKPVVVDLVRNIIIEQQFFKLQKKTKFLILDNLLKDLCKTYNIKKIELKYIPLNNPIEYLFLYNGFYNKDNNTLYLNEKLSLITFLHEFKHAVQHLKNKPNNEEIARGYSLSLFYLASPKHFNNALKKGLIFHMKI